MKFNYVVAVIGMLLVASLHAQVIKPTSLSFVAIPGYESSPQRVSFTNTGPTQITLTISISGPFAVPYNFCGAGVKPGTHCDVYVTYAPTGLETDTGVLTFDFNGQAVQVLLTGKGVNIIPTGISRTFSKTKQQFNVTMNALGNIIPDGEFVNLSCSSIGGGDGMSGFGQLHNNRTIISIRGTPSEMWECELSYNGDAQFAASTAGPFRFHN